MQFWYILFTSPIILITALLIGTFGEMLKSVINVFRTIPKYDATGHLLPTKTKDGQLITYRDSKGRIIPPPDPLWIRLFDATLPGQPVIIGLLLGCIPWLPAEDSLLKEQYELAGHLATYGAAGIICKVAYDILVTTIRRFVASQASQFVVATTPIEVNPTPSPPPETDPTPSMDSTPLDNSDQSPID